MDVPIFCGFSRAKIDQEFVVAGDHFRPYVGDLQNCLFDPVDRLDGSYHSTGFVVERPHAWRYRAVGSAGLQDPAQPDDLGELNWTDVRRWADVLAVAAAAGQVGEKLKPHHLQHAKPFTGIPEILWIETADPLIGASSSHFSRDWTWQDENASPLTRTTAHYAGELQSVDDDSFPVAIRRVRLALDQPRAWEDALVDAVIAWEALRGNCRDSVTLMTTAFLAELISAETQRHQVRKALRALYKQRNHVVHGGALVGDEVPRWRDQAITAAFVAIKQLCGEHRALLGHSDRFERLCLDEDVTAHGSSGG